MQQSQPQVLTRKGDQQGQENDTSISESAV